MVTPLTSPQWALLTVSDFNMTATVEQINAAFELWQIEDAKFSEKGNKAAGTRARKALLELGKLTKVRRTEISEAKAEG